MLRSDPLPPDAATWRQRLHTVIFEADTPIMAVPTGIVSSEMTSRRRTGTSRQSCPACGREGHDRDAVHCKFCGAARLIAFGTSCALAMHSPLSPLARRGSG